MASTSPEYGVSPIERLIRDAAVSLAIKRYIAERQTCKDVPEGCFVRGAPAYTLVTAQRGEAGNPE